MLKYFLTCHMGHTATISIRVTVASCGTLTAFALGATHVGAHRIICYIKDIEDIC